jgi:hypothetical protein
VTVNPPQSLPTVLADFEEDGRRKQLLVVARDGLPEGRPIFPFEVIGVYDPVGPPPHSGPDGFRQNGTFLHFLHWVISQEVPNLEGAWQEALSLGDGLLQVLDGRWRPAHRNQDPSPEDILGHFEVADGEIVEGSYKPTMTHIALTGRGLFELDPELCEKILERLEAQVDIEMKKKSAH